MIRVGLIGAGLMGRRHLDALSRDDRVRVAAVADAAPTAAEAAAAPLGPTPCRTLADLVRLGVDAVFVALPNAYHASAVLEVDDAFHSIAVLDAAYTSIRSNGEPVSVARE